VRELFYPEVTSKIDGLGLGSRSITGRFAEADFIEDYRPVERLCSLRKTLFFVTGIIINRPIVPVQGAESDRRAERFSRLGRFPWELFRGGF
jgi:hypothetical protein